MNTRDLDQQFADLCAHPRFSRATRRDVQNGCIITLPDTVLPVGWSHETATLLFYVTNWFPSEWPKHFWTVENVNLAGNRIPQWTRSERRYNPPETEEPLTWWAYQPSVWSPVGDTLTTYAHFIRRRFETLR